MPISHDLLRLKLAESLALRAPLLTRRDVQLPGIRGKTFAVIGVRRGGKTSFLFQCRADRIGHGASADGQLFLSLEDERLVGLSAIDLGWLLEEHARQFPGLRETGGMTVYLDEVQLVEGWERLVRRMIDAGEIEVFVSGSSAKLLSREVATRLRGRAMEVLVHPFSFREALRHAGTDLDRPYARLTHSERATLDQRLRRYLAEGGFPGAQGADARDRAALLSGYVDVVVLRDVIERHAVTNPLALRWIERQLLANPGGAFSVKKHYDTLRSQGISVSKDTLHAYLAHLEDAFLVRTIAMHSASERQRMVNPRKAYPVDPGLIALFERSASTHKRPSARDSALARARAPRLRGVVRANPGWLRGRLLRPPSECEVAARAGLPRNRRGRTWDRELRALVSARTAHPDAEAWLVTLDAQPPQRPLPDGMRWAPAAQWLLEEM